VSSRAIRPEGTLSKGENSVSPTVDVLGTHPGFIHGLIREMPALGRDRGESSVSETLRNYLQWKLMEAVDVTGPATEA